MKAQHNSFGVHKRTPRGEVIPGRGDNGRHLLPGMTVLFTVSPSTQILGPNREEHQRFEARGWGSDATMGENHKATPLGRTPPWVKTTKPHLWVGRHHG